MNHIFTLLSATVKLLILIKLIRVKLTPEEKEQLSDFFKFYRPFILTFGGISIACVIAALQFREYSGIVSVISNALSISALAIFYKLVNNFRFTPEMKKGFNSFLLLLVIHHILWFAKKFYS